MNLSNYKYFFVNGCSFTQGGGLEEPNIRVNSCRPIYEECYNVTWNNRSEVNWGTRLSEIINIPCINYAKCGAGTSYVVRTTYDFIFENWKNKDKFFIILERPSPDRFEVFDNETKQYYIVNSFYDRNNDNYTFNYATTGYWLNDDNNIQEKFKTFYNNHCNVEKNALTIDKEFIGLYSFCKLHNIKIIVTENVNIPYYYSIDSLIDNNDFYPNHIHNYSVKNKLTITDELSKCNGKFEDFHPGYFGHIKYAEELAKFLDKK